MHAEEQTLSKPQTSPPILNSDIIVPTMATVCIAALADKGKEAVLIADKLLTSDGVLPYQIEAAANKIIKINDDVNIMFCGGVTDATVIIEKAKKNLGSIRLVEDVAALVNDEHLRYLLGMLSRAQVLGRGIESLERYYTDRTLNLPEDIRRQIDVVLSTHTLASNTCFIVCGKGDDGLFKIYYLNPNPRAQPSLITQKYSTIGSGSGYANFSIIQSSYNDALSSEKVKDILLKAKKEAEKDRDVGASEDIVMMK